MKNFLFLVSLLAGMASASQAQQVVALPLTAGDTIVNTGTASKVISITTGQSGIAVQAIFTKISGATIAGTAVLAGCNDGVTYTAIGSSFTLTNVASQSTMFYVAAPLPKFMRVQTTGSGTESVVQTVIYRLPRYQAP